MTEPVTYRRTDLVSTVTMDDGKVNVFSIPMLRALHEAFDEAERDGTVVLLTGRPGYFSAGFDLGVLAGPPDDVLTLLRLGATLAERILSFPAPVAVACTGHAFPAGAFLLMAADTRVGAGGPVQTRPQRGEDRPHPAVVRSRARPAPPRPRALRPRRGHRNHVRPEHGPGGRTARQRRPAGRAGRGRDGGRPGT